MKDRLADLLVEYDAVLAVLDERVQTRPPLQAPTALDAIRHIREIRARLDGIAGVRDEERGEELKRAGLELERRTEELQDCAGEAFPRRATSLHGIAEELIRMGGRKP